ncbi:MAG: hypothetical protein QOG72_3042, partial [Sphingomonadales bacterium]|nr:hypothetical protein [Sphingomonadales bacterium]
MVQLYRRKGDDRLVNTTTLATQSAPSVAVLQGGGYVVVWTDDSRTGGDASEESIKGQRFDANGDKVGGEFLVNSATSNDQLDPSVAGLPSGRFVVTWTDPSGVGGDFDGTAIKGQLFEADGTRVGSEFRINTQTAGNQDDTVVTELEGGGFVVTWADSDEIGSSDSTPPAIKAQLFDAAGAKVGGEILVDLETQGFQGEPSVTGLPGGGFAIVWTDGLAFNDKLIRLQLFDSAGARIGGEQVVNAARNVVVNGPNIAVLESGFVVTWAQQDHSEGYASTDVIGQRFDLSGAKVGAEFVVNTGTAGAQSDPDAHALPGGGFIVTWMGHGDGLSVLNIFGQVFDAAGNKQGPAFVINTITEANQLWPEVEVLPSGDIVVVWHDISHSGDDPSGAVRAQILTVSTAPATDIALSGTRISETAREDVPLIVLKTAGALNSNPTYSIVSDSSGGAFGIAGDKLVVNDHSLLDFEITNQVQLRIRTTDENGVSYEETIQLAIADVPEAGYAPDGDEFLVNTTTQDNQTQPVIASLASGGYVAIWSQTPLGGGSPVGKAQIFDAAGNKVGGELPIRGEDAVGLPGGGFVTTWIEPGASANVSFIKAQVYDAAGNAVGAEITNKSSFSFLQVNPSVATLAPGGAMPSGGFVLTWNEPLDSDSSAVMAQLYQPNGQKVFFGPFQVNSYTGFEPEVAGLENGNYVVVWRTADGEIRGQMFTPLNERFGVDFEVSTLAGAIEPHVAALAGGGFVVTYMGSSVSDLSAQIFDANGVKVGSEIPIAELGISRPDSTDVVGLPWGGFVVSWSGHEDSDASTDDAGTRARVFDSTGEPLGPELAVNQAAFNEQTQSTMAVLASGEVIVGWADSSGLGGDHSGYGIKARLLQLVDPGNSGNDILTGDGGDNLLQGGAGDDQLFGLGGTDTLEGGAGDDVLDGGPGADTMRGGADDDIYYVDDAGDVVEENAGQGTDEVRTSLDGYSLLGTQIENLTATTNGPHDLRGSAGDNVVTGAAGNDLLRLNDGGNDSAFGGGGNDVLYFGGAFTG